MHNVACQGTWLCPSLSQLPPSFNTLTTSRAFTLPLSSLFVTSTSFIVISFRLTPSHFKIFNIYQYCINSSRSITTLTDHAQWVSIVLVSLTSWPKHLVHPPRRLSSISLVESSSSYLTIKCMWIYFCKGRRMLCKSEGAQASGDKGIEAYWSQIFSDFDRFIVTTSRSDA